MSGKILLPGEGTSKKGFWLDIGFRTFGTLICIAAGIAFPFLLAEEGFEGFDLWASAIGGAITVLAPLVAIWVGAWMRWWK
jgi:hypothetical protein